MNPPRNHNVCKMMAILVEGAERTFQCGQEQNKEAWQTLGTPTPSWNTKRLWSQSFQELLNKFEIWWPCESTPHINPVTHNFFMSTGMLCEQNNVFLTLAFQGDSLQLWPVFPTLLSEWGWVVVTSGLSYWRSRDLGCSFVVFIYSNSESAVSRVSFLVRFVSVPHCEFLFLEMLWKAPAHVSLSCLSPSLVLVPLPTSVTVSHYSKCWFLRSWLTLSFEYLLLFSIKNSCNFHFSQMNLNFSLI